MKKKFLYAVFIAVVALAGCQDDPKNPGGEEPMPSEIIVSPTSLEFSYETDREEVSISSNVDWVVAIAESDSWVSASVENGTGNAKVTIFVEENTGEELRSSTIEFSTNDGANATLYIEQAAKEVPSGGDTYVPEDLEGPFGIEITRTTPSGISANVDTDGYDGNWYVCAVNYGVYLEDFNDPINMAVEFLDMEVSYYKTDLSIVDNIYVFNGSQSSVDLLAGWASTPDTQFAFCLFGVDDQGALVTEITFFTAWTADVPQTDFTIDCQYKNITSSSVNFEIYPSDQETYYIYTFFDAQSIEDHFAEGFSEDELFETVVDFNKDDNNQLLVKRGDMVEDGDGNPLSLSNLSPAIEYSFVGYGLSIDEYNYLNGRCTDAQICNFTTLGGGSSAPSYSWSSVEPCSSVVSGDIPQRSSRMAKRVRAQVIIR